MAARASVSNRWMSSTLSTLDLTDPLLDSVPSVADLTEDDAICEMRAAARVATQVTIVSADVSGDVSADVGGDASADLSGGARSAAR